MYFNVQTARKPGLRTTSQSRSSTYLLSQNAGWVKTVTVSKLACLMSRVQLSGAIPTPEQTALRDS
jgi:hypothetical protein